MDEALGEEEGMVKENRRTFFVAGMIRVDGVSHQGLIH